MECVECDVCPVYRYQNNVRRSKGLPSCSLGGKQLSPFWLLVYCSIILLELLKHFTTPEHLDGTSFSCSTCSRGNQSADKQLLVCEAPEVSQSVIVATYLS